MLGFEENMKIFRLEILEKVSTFFKIKITDGTQTVLIAFSPVSKNLVFLTNRNELADYLKNNEYQIRKMLHNKKPETYYVGFKLKFVIKNNKKVKNFNDFNNLIVLDRRNGQYKTYTIPFEEKRICKIYTDACYYTDIKLGGYAAIIKKTNNRLDLVWGQEKGEKSSTLLELIAAIKGLEKAKNTDQIRIITDSRYVIKGLTEWILNWKLNDWHTIQGRKVRNIEYWEKFLNLTENKYIEFQWIKGHSQHFENSLCDYYARQAAFYKTEQKNPEKNKT